MSDIPDLPQKTAGDLAHTLVKAAAAGVPVVGGSAAELIGIVFAPPLGKTTGEMA